MKAWQLSHPAPAISRPLQLAEVPEPQPGPGEIRLRVRACGVCLTDVHIAEGDLVPPEYPVTPGHQVVGVVDAVGPGVEGIRPGERRGAYWLHQACGRCEACRRGEENLCPHARFTGLHVPGGYAEAMVVPAAYTVPVPPAFDDATAAPLLCAGVIGYRALRLSGLRAGERLALFGFGSSAHLVLQVARHQGCQVVVFTRSPAHRELARRLGAAWAGGAEVLRRDEPAVPGTPAAAGDGPSEPGLGGAAANGRTHPTPARAEIPLPCDRAIVFAPAGELVPLALRAVRPGGTVVINAVHMSDIPSFPYRLLHGERVLRSVAHVTRRDAEEFMALAAALPLQVAVQRYPFDQANRALADVKESRVNGAAVLVVGEAPRRRPHPGRQP